MSLSKAIADLARVVEDCLPHEQARPAIDRREVVRDSRGRVLKVIRVENGLVTRATVERDRNGQIARVTEETEALDADYPHRRGGARR